MFAPPRSWNFGFHVVFVLKGWKMLKVYLICRLSTGNLNPSKKRKKWLPFFATKSHPTQTKNRQETHVTLSSPRRLHPLCTTCSVWSPVAKINGFSQEVWHLRPGGLLPSASCILVEYFHSNIGPPKTGYRLNWYSPPKWHRRQPFLKGICCLFCWGKGSWCCSKGVHLLEQP